MAIGKCNKKWCDSFLLVSLRLKNPPGSCAQKTSTFSLGGSTLHWSKKIVIMGMVLLLVSMRNIWEKQKQESLHEIQPTICIHNNYREYLSLCRVCEKSWNTKISWHHGNFLWGNFMKISHEDFQLYFVSPAQQVL